MNDLVVMPERLFTPLRTKGVDHVIFAGQAGKYGPAPAVPKPVAPAVAVAPEVSAMAGRKGCAAGAVICVRMI